MQINGAHLATAFAPKPLELQEQTRKPVTIDASASFKLDDASAQVKSEAQTTVQAPITVNDGQQARFVRFFSASDEVSSNSQQELPSFRPLPQGLEHYNQIANIQNQPEKTYLDEIV